MGARLCVRCFGFRFGEIRSLQIASVIGLVGGAGLAALALVSVVTLDGVSWPSFY